MARARKPTNLDKQLETWSAVIVDDPTALKGRWAETFMPDAREVRLDLGCGKGAFLAKSAQANPDVLYVGIDFSETCIARCGEKVVTGGVDNVQLVIADASDIMDFFAPGELSRIHLNFNAPYPQSKYAKGRLTHLDHLVHYRELLGEEGIVELRTDNMPYWKFTLVEMDIAGYQIYWKTEDLHSDPDRDPDLIRSEYDEKLVEKGAVVYALMAHPGPAPATMVQTDKLSLIDYLPEDLDTLEHIPYGMEDTIFNMKNRKRNAAIKQERHEKWLARQAKRKGPRKPKA